MTDLVGLLLRVTVAQLRCAAIASGLSKKEADA